MDLACWQASNLTIGKHQLSCITYLLRSDPCSSQALLAATATAASAHAHLLTLIGLTAVCLAHSIHSKLPAEAMPLL